MAHGFHQVKRKVTEHLCFLRLLFKIAANPRLCAAIRLHLCIAALSSCSCCHFIAISSFWPRYFGTSTLLNRGTEQRILHTRKHELVSRFLIYVVSSPFSPMFSSIEFEIDEGYFAEAFQFRYILRNVMEMTQKRNSFTGKSLTIAMEKRKILDYNSVGAFNTRDLHQTQV